MHSLYLITSHRAILIIYTGSALDPEQDLPPTSSLLLPLLCTTFFDCGPSSPSKSSLTEKKRSNVY
ncbi:hypothetical protein NC653_030124 [Populus alba x Populus x berolinensis]|uniref:Uncharacterized protein n=1 Tax=Populus alba x Populus x berolinensis TaxID=444605 RepID=A0AAD6LVL9_9ROSI|nr:hypothetical protein NC653_030124 [Populus alba x Populus x berolinensis]